MSRTDMAPLRHSSVDDGVSQDEEHGVSGGSSKMNVSEMVDALGMGPVQLCLFGAAGLGFCGDSFELLVLSFVLPLFVEQWSLSLSMQALVTSTAFLGWLVGSAVWGVLADRFGRKKVFAIVLISLIVVGMMQLAIMNLALLLLLRFLMGWAVGGVFTGYALLAELLPSKHRVVTLSVFQGWFPLGSVLGAALAITVLGTPGSWRLLLALGTLPIAAALALLLFIVPESPRYLAVSNSPVELQASIAHLARYNGRSLAGKVLKPDEKELRKEASLSIAERLQVVFSPSLRWRSAALFGLWFFASFVYYGIVLFSPSFFASSHDAALSPAASTLVTSLAEVPLLVGGGVLSLYVGRRDLIAACFFGTSVALGGMAFGGPLLLAASLLARGLASAAFAVTALLTLEVYQTSARATGFGFCNSASRVAGVATPWIAIALGGSNWIPLLVYAAASGAAGCVALFCFVNKKGSAPLE